MLNEEATKLSEGHLPEMIEYLKTTRPYIKEVHLTEHSNLNSDYFYKKDAICCGASHDYRIQFKARQEGHNDLCFKGLKQSGKDALSECSGFYYRNSKYSFDIPVDLYVERLGNGEIYTISRETLEALEAKYPEYLSKVVNVYQSYKYDSNGNSFPSQEYDIYISPYDLAQGEIRLLRDANIKVDDMFA